MHDKGMNTGWHDLYYISFIFQEANRFRAPAGEYVFGEGGVFHGKAYTDLDNEARRDYESTRNQIKKQDTGFIIYVYSFARCCYPKRLK